MILVTPVIILQILSTYIFFDRHWSKMSSRLAFAVAGEVAVIADQIENNPAPKNIRRIAGYAAQNLELLISFDSGSELVLMEKQHEGWETIVAGLLADAMKKQVRRPFDIAVDIDEKWVAISVQLSNGLLHVTLPQSRLFSSSGYIFLLWMFGISLVLMVIAILFMRNQIRPIRRLAVAAERFGKGRDVQSFKPEGAREVRQAAREFLEMRDRIKRQISQRTAMLAGVSHDLRTPLTRLKLQIAMLGEGPDVDACKADIEAMEKMIQGYLDFVRGEQSENPVYTDISEIMSKIVESSNRQGERQISLYAEENLKMAVRPVAFERCITNLVANAKKYGNRVWLSARRFSEHIEIMVDDDGPGIPEDQYEEVFRPFHRVDVSRNIETGGIGLGLPISMDIIHAHGGRIWLEKSNRGGLRVVISLPL
jgi:two-component system osmolarity sensor histidine kinase EnvZ